MILVPLSLAAATHLAAPAPASVPRLDIWPGCHSAFILIPDVQSTASCLRDEQEAEGQLARNWST